MSFFDEYEKLDQAAIRQAIRDATSRDVERVLSKNSLEPGDLPVLFSPAADPYLEEFARRSAAVTERRFGKVIVLYAPIYLSNECVNHCVYCGFNRGNDIARITLTPEEAVQEAQYLYDEGFRHILVVSGESPKHVGYHYLTSVISQLHKKFASVAIEIYPMDTDGYRAMEKAGVDGLALYQETYDRELYATLHPKGPKRDFKWRLEAPERGGMAGFRSLGLGALLGLCDWRFEAVLLGLHGRYLTRKFWKSRVAVSFPRLRPASGGYEPAHPVSDRDMVHMLCGLRMLLPDAEMVVSTRESAEFRNNLIGLGITRMSAGSKTNPGGYGDQEKAGQQFCVEDNRSPHEVMKVIEEKGHEPVWKDFDRNFIVP